MPSPDHPHTRLLDPDERQALLTLIPLLRIADSLDRSHDQRVQSIACQVQNNQAAITVDSPADIDLEQWAAERAGDIFRQVYQVPLVVTRAAR
jgi:exopolyphosphatase/guanosine-5'-triphosphate,3'-diphosphate pyrophosphatase